MTFLNNSSHLGEIRHLLFDPQLFSPLDSHFASFIGRLAEKHNISAALAGALVSHTTTAGNVCLDLAEYAGEFLPLDSGQKDKRAFVCPPFADWREQLLQSGVVGHDEDDTPLVLVGSRLYLRRYREYESTVINFIRRRADSVCKGINFDILSRDLEKLFTPLPDMETDWQKVAAIAAVSRSFCVISGGPGTGKTSTVAKILALLSDQESSKRQQRILLAAPTGKAASRLQQAIAETGQVQPESASLEASTLHRMLGYIPNSPYFRHNAENRLAADIIVIDEASMVDLPLMAKLMQAVPDSARLILLGDHYQLASVQPGSVLGDICRTEFMANFSAGFEKNVVELTGSSISTGSSAEKTPIASLLQDSFVELVKSFRFKPESSITRLSKAVKDGDADGALDILLKPDDDSIAWSETPGPADLAKALLNTDLVKHYRELQQVSEPDSCFTLLDDFRLLCGLRQGPFGAARINNILVQQFAHKGHAPASNYADLPELKSISLPVRPVMISRNDYNLQLFNGDIGIIMADPEDPESIRTFFREEPGMLRSVAPSLLPGHETVFAMTVHKSQGSEYKRLLLILPDHDSPLLTRELLYTGITRARQKVEIWGRKEIFAAAVKRRIKRTSGLSEELWDSAGQE